MTSRFVIAPDVTRRVERLPDVRAVLHRAAEGCADEAQRNAPVQTGDYRDGIEATSGVDQLGPFGRVNAHDFKSLWIEFGTKDQPPRAVLRQALDTARIR